MIMGRRGVGSSRQKGHRSMAVGTSVQCIGECRLFKLKFRLVMVL